MSRADDARRVREAVRVLHEHGFELDEWENACLSERIARSCPWGLYLAARKARMVQLDGYFTRLGHLMSDPDVREPLRWENR